MWKLIIAGILNIIAAVFIYLYAFLTFLLAIEFESLGHFSLVIAVFIIGTLALISGIFALKRKKWGLVLIGSMIICAVSILFLIVSVKPLFELPTAFAWIGIPAVILVAFSKKEFRFESSEEH